MPSCRISGILRKKGLPNQICVAPKTLSPWNNQLMRRSTQRCAIRLPHANLSTFHIILSTYYHNNKIEYMTCFDIVLTRYTYG